jgi:hypothetical protein
MKRLSSSIWARPLTKKQEFDVIGSGGIYYKTVEIQEASVQVIDKTAILLNKICLVAVRGGNEVINPFVVTEVYVQQSGTWKLASLSFTRLLTQQNSMDEVMKLQTPGRSGKVEIFGTMKSITVLLLMIATIICLLFGCTRAQQIPANDPPPPSREKKILIVYLSRDGTNWKLWKWKPTNLFDLSGRLGRTSHPPQTSLHKRRWTFRSSVSNFQSYEIVN